MKRVVAVVVLVVMGGVAACGGTQPPVSATAESKAGAERNADANHPPATLAPAATPSSKPLTFHDLSVIAGVDCKDVDKGRDCSTGNYEAGDYYDVDLSPDCGKDGLFGGVVSRDGTSLLDKAPPKDTRSLATLADGQLVCIQATAHIKGEPHWYYVTAVPADSLEGCAGTALCQRYGDREVKWHVERTGPACRSDGPWQFSGACAAGWAAAADFDVFSNGLSFIQ